MDGATTSQRSSSGNTYAPTGSEPKSLGMTTVPDPTPSLWTAETHQPPTGPTTRSALHPTFVPSCTSIETSLVESDATTAWIQTDYGRVTIGRGEVSCGSGSAAGTEYLDIVVSGSTATCSHAFRYSGGGCSGGIENTATVEDGKMVLYVWGTASVNPCS
jgi:hypothetical protein